MKRIIEKIKKHGFGGTIKAAFSKLCDVINIGLYYFFWLFPIQDKIIFESEGDFSDNTYALYNYLINHKYLQEKFIVWFVDNIKNSEKGIIPILKNPKGIDITRSYHMATAKLFIYDHSNMYFFRYHRKGLKIVYLSHGCGYKSSKGSDVKHQRSHYDIITTTGPLASTFMADYWCEPENKCRELGYPRNDYFFENDPTLSVKIREIYNFDKYKKVFFWMPTFRQSNNRGISEDYLHNETGLPLFGTEKDLFAFSDFLKDQNILLVFKLHHLQADLPVFHKTFSNILILRDEELLKSGIQLYQFVSQADAVISDYSSITVDFLLMNRPMIFTLDDYEKYDKSRGVYPENAKEYMKGYHVVSVQELNDAIIEILSGVDKYREARKSIIHEYHTYTDGNSSKRITQYLIDEKYL